MKDRIKKYASIMKNPALAILIGLAVGAVVMLIHMPGICPLRQLFFTSQEYYERYPHVQGIEYSAASPQ